MPVGFISSEPADVRADFQHLRRWRKSVEQAQSHCGNALQLRLMRASECRARRKGWSCIVSDTTENLVSANNFIRAGSALPARMSVGVAQHTVLAEIPQEFISCLEGHAPRTTFEWTIRPVA